MRAIRATNDFRHAHVSYGTGVRCVMRCTPETLMFSGRQTSRWLVKPSFKFQKTTFLTRPTRPTRPILVKLCFTSVPLGRVGQQKGLRCFMKILYILYTQYLHQYP